MRHSIQLETLELFTDDTDKRQQLSVAGQLNNEPLTLSMSLPHVNAKSATQNLPIRLPLELVVAIGDVTVDASGVIGMSTSWLTNVRKIDSMDIMFHYQSPDTDWIFDALGSDKSLPGALMLEARISGIYQTYDLTVNKMEFASDQIQARLDGSVSDILDSARATIDVKVQAHDMSLAAQLWGGRLPREWGHLSGTAVIEGSRGRYAVHEISAALNGSTTASISGSINSLLPLNDMRLDVSVALASLTELATFTAFPLSDIGPLVGSGVVQWREGKLSLTDARVSYNGKHGQLEVSGKIGDLFRFDEARIRLDVVMPDFSALEYMIKTALPSVDSIVGSANLISVTAGDLSARNVLVRGRKDDVVVVVKGEIGSFIQGDANLDLELTSKLNSLAQMRDILGIELPDIGPVEASARLTGVNDSAKLTDLVVDFHDPELTGSLHSKGGLLSRIDDIDVELNLSTPSVQDALAKLGISNAINKPADLSAQLSLERGVVELSNVQLDIDGNQILANLTLDGYQNRDARMNISGDVRLVKLNLLDLYEEHNDVNGVSERKTDKLLSDRNISYKWIDLGEIDVKLIIDDYSSFLFEISNAVLPIKTSNGVLSAGPFAGTLNNGDADFQLRVDAKSDPPRIDLILSLDAVDLSRAGLFEGTKKIDNAGGTNANAYLISEGDSLSSLLANAYGIADISIQNLVFKQGALRIFSSDMLDQLVDALNPFKETVAQTRFSCAAAIFQITNGVLATPFGYALEAKDFSIIGNGRIDFRSEWLDLEFTSKPKKGLGIGFNKFTSLAKLNGPLSSPKISFNEKGVLRFGATVTAGILTGGLSLLAEGLWDKYKANSDVCADALGRYI